MIKYFSLILFCLSFHFSNAQNSEMLAKEQIKLVMSFQESAWNSGNIPQYMQGYWKSDSLLFIGKRGPTYGWSETLSNYLKAYPTKDKMGKLSFVLNRIDILSENAALILGKWQLDRNEDKLQGYFSLLWRLIDGEWKITVDHTSSSD